MPEAKRYTLDQKAQAMALAAEIGLGPASRQLDIPIATLKAWRSRLGPVAGIPAADSPQRDDHGRWLPGKSANPAGRRAERRVAIQKAEAAAPEAIDLVIALMRDPGVPVKIRLEAANTVLDRALGKPKQAVSMDMDLTERHEYEITQRILAERPELLDEIFQYAPNEPADPADQ